MKLRVLLADDHAMFRQALRMSLATDPDIEVVAEVEDGHGVLACFDDTHPDVVCMDIDMPRLSGIEATRRLIAAHPEARIVGLSAYSSPLLAAEMIKAGALGYVVKMDAGPQLPIAIRMASRNQTYLGPELGAKDVAELTRYALQVSAPHK